MRNSRRTPEKKQREIEEPTSTGTRRSQSFVPSPIIPMTATTMKKIINHQKSVLYKGHQLSKCCLIGRLVDAVDEDSKYKILFSDGDCTELYYSKFHKHLEESVTSALDNGGYWRVIVEPKVHEGGFDFYCVSLEEVFDHHMISDHMASVIHFNIKLREIYPSD